MSQKANGMEPLLQNEPRSPLCFEYELEVLENSDL